MITNTKVATQTDLQHDEQQRLHEYENDFIRTKPTQSRNNNSIKKNEKQQQ